MVAAVATKWTWGETKLIVPPAKAMTVTLDGRTHMLVEAENDAVPPQTPEETTTERVPKVIDDAPGPDQISSVICTFT
jgi:hypothetical protein